MTLLHRLTCLIFLTLGCIAPVSAINWPIAPFDQSPSLGNSYGEYQYYGSYPYFHPGVDILAPAGTHVYAVKAGYVKAVLTIAADLHWRVAIGDSAGPAECDGWLYAHLDPATIAVSEGEWVEEGQYLGDLVYWPIADFHHLHFVKIRNSGYTWDSDWQFIANPLDEIPIIDDTIAPRFMNAYGVQRFAFCQNESASYFSSGESLSGDVDIICRADDQINHAWRVAPFRMEYRISGDSSIPWTNSVCFNGPLNWDTDITSVYQDDAYCDSRGDYDYRWFYFNLTNTDGDSLIEAEDRPLSWQTAYFHNGDYTIYARAWDRAGNSTTDSMVVTVENYFALSGSIQFDDGNPQLEGSMIGILHGGPADSTDEAGNFTIPMVPGGSQTIRVTRTGYETVDTLLMMNRHRQLTITLLPVYYVNGDANLDDEINVGDPVFVINYIFKGGPPPAPFLAGDANSDLKIDVGDAVYLVNFIFRNGPPPANPRPANYTALFGNK